ncbi:hypothetical protein HKX48_006373 [Thoreauomyces humboldtii]|nr:hypothetical protein HKX48_006373 [Thoreauomyces humboldtii]
MHSHFAISVLVLASATAVFGHGYVSSPAIRTVGPAYEAACGQTIYNTQLADKAGNIQDLENKRGSGFQPEACNLWLCKGYQAADIIASNVQHFTTGQVVPISVDIVAPHTGSANVSIVDLRTNTVIGSPLIEIPVFASTSTPIPESNRQFSVTIPELNGKCGTVGSCALQFYWDSPSAKQTYESCIDFTLTGIAAAVTSPSSSAAVPSTGSTALAATSSVNETASATATIAPVESATSPADATSIETTVVQAAATATPTVVAKPKCYKRSKASTMTA